MRAGGFAAAAEKTAAGFGLHGVAAHARCGRQGYPGRRFVRGFFSGFCEEREGNRLLRAELCAAAAFRAAREVGVFRREVDSLRADRAADLAGLALMRKALGFVYCRSERLVKSREKREKCANRAETVAPAPQHDPFKDEDDRRSEREPLHVGAGDEVPCAQNEGKEKTDGADETEDGKAEDGGRQKAPREDAQRQSVRSRALRLGGFFRVNRNALLFLRCGVAFHQKARAEPSAEVAAEEKDAGHKERQKDERARRDGARGGVVFKSSQRAERRDRFKSRGAVGPKPQLEGGCQKKGDDDGKTHGLRSKEMLHDASFFFFKGFTMMPRRPPL